MPIVMITLVEGRSTEAKKTLLRKVTDAVEEAIEAPRSTIRVILQEVPPEHWGVAGEAKKS